MTAISVLFNVQQNLDHAILREKQWIDLQQRPFNGAMFNWELCSDMLALHEPSNKFLRDDRVVYTETSMRAILTTCPTYFNSDCDDTGLADILMAELAPSLFNPDEFDWEGCSWVVAKYMRSEIENFEHLFNFKAQAWAYEYYVTQDHGIDSDDAVPDFMKGDGKSVDLLRLMKPALDEGDEDESDDDLDGENEVDNTDYTDEQIASELGVDVSDLETIGFDPIPDGMERTFRKELETLVFDPITDNMERTSRKERKRLKATLARKTAKYKKRLSTQKRKHQQIYELYLAARRDLSEVKTGKFVRATSNAGSLSVADAKRNRKKQLALLITNERKTQKIKSKYEAKVDKLNLKLRATSLF